MAVLFQIINSIFLFFTFLMGMFLLRGNILFGAPAAQIIKMILMPAYLILAGVVVGYLISVIWKTKEEKSDSLEQKEKICKNSFLIGIGIGIILALSYLFI